MTRVSIRIAATAAAAFVAVAAYAGAQPQTGASNVQLVAYAPTVDAVEEFADAPFGVDAMVTGPVSPAFKSRRMAAGCETAEWPNIPSACYPDRPSR